MKSFVLSFILITTLFGDFVKDANVIKNSDNNLVYSDDVEVTYTWSDAINYCEELTLDGEEDWRLPNVKELLFIIGGYPQRDSTMPNKLNGAFINKSATVNYWSSTTNKSQSSEAYLVNAMNGTLLTNTKTNTNSVICVRGE